MARQHRITPRALGRIETLEDRRVMSADPLIDALSSLDDQPLMVDQHILATEPDFWIDTSLQTGLDGYLGGVEQMLAQAHALTGWNGVQSNYGFTGLGQTVAVIDSGIAWDHFALGGGMGSNYRVVGGWDFTEENDNNPYDDGASGGHGTHVSGIIGSSSSTHTGVAPGVDLVGLRVFNDTGQGFFTWIENALKWLHTNRNSFENPITAVNLSLGVSNWNAATIPQWATLEDEFAQLEADGIFIAVSAGNSYSSYNAAGLSYPAASQYVVPVMSTNDAGVMSPFSQRLSRAIAAPGQSITSTVPDYKGNKNGLADDYATMSGTSMAAPYVAGASVLIRQAMQFVGMTGINQDKIYDHMMATADTFFDSATNQNYKRLNLGRAIDSLMPADDYGSTAATAHNLGSFAAQQSVSGKLAKLTDVDYFTFTASASGSVNFKANPSAGMTPQWQVTGATPTQNSAGVLAFQVVAGQKYTVGLSSSSGMGSYTIDAKLSGAGFSATDWGTIAYNQFNDVSVAGERWFRVVATREAFLTAQAAFNAAGGSVNLAIFNSSMQQIAAGATAGGVARVDANAAAAGQYYVRVTGANADVDFTLSNLVTHKGTTVTAVGTAGNDLITFNAGSTQTIYVNALGYTFTAAAANTFNINGDGGTDSLVINGSSAAETMHLRATSASVAATYNLNATSVERVTAVSGGGADQAYLYDSAGNDKYTGWSTRSTIEGTGYFNEVRGFPRTTVTTTTGTDAAVFYDSAGDDAYVARPDRAYMQGVGYYNDVRGFDSTVAIASTGNDQAVFYDSAGVDAYTAYPDRATMVGTNYSNEARGFDKTTATSSGGSDRAMLYDSLGNDTYSAYSDRTIMEGAGFSNEARGFSRTTAVASAGGVDAAFLYDSVGNDELIVLKSSATMRGAKYRNETSGFEKVTASLAAGGVDTKSISAADFVFTLVGKTTAGKTVGKMGVK